MPRPAATRVAISSVVAATERIDAVVSCADAAVSATEAARLAVLTVTWSTDAAISFIDETRPSADDGHRLRLRRGLRQRCGHLGDFGDSGLEAAVL